ncbi:MAG: ribosome assembly cofactor RimP [Candidatus Cloacimonadaceae bacterium]
MQYYRVQIEEIAKRICSVQQLALYDIDEKMSGKGRIITVYLTKIGGVTLDDCAQFSRALGAELESLDFIPERYYLEVSSPGVQRPLKLKSHYVSAINEKVAIQFTSDGEKKSVMGTLTEVDQDEITLDDRGTSHVIPFKAISRAKTVYIPDWREKDER